MVKEAQDGAVFVEVGAWKGRSAAFMCVEIINSGKKIEFHVVDHFLGSKEHATEPAVKGGILFAEFNSNMRPVYGAYELHSYNSLTAAATFADASIDFVYIDASHEYEDVKRDIQGWLPKMKPGALLAGDDFESYKGVGQAVAELLPGFTRNGNVWEYRCPALT